MIVVRLKCKFLGRANMTSKKEVLITFGTRPEAIKMAPVVHAFRQRSDFFNTTVCVTGQHREMLDQVLRIFDISPDFDLDIMKSGQDLTDVTTHILSGMKAVLSTKSFDAVLVHGDTTTTVAAAVASFYRGLPVGHVEAGLRTYDLQAPFPEEFNRQITTKIANWHFAPTDAAAENLSKEGVKPSQIFITGNTVIDALNMALDRLDRDDARRSSIQRQLAGILPFDYSTSRFVLITGHRRENFGGGFIEICHAISDLAGRFSDTHFVYPVHLNPNVQKPVYDLLGSCPNVHLIKPLDYEPFIWLLKNCYLVLTDSGGVQEEAPGLGKPVLVMRDVTERPEAVKAGTVRLVGANRQQICSGITELLTDVSAYDAMSRAHNPYGDGTAANRIVTEMTRLFFKK